jgi:polysaccharide export outer membrane protein
MKIKIALIGLALSLITLTANAQDDYRLNPGDILKISVWNEEALQQEVLVLPNGTISFPLVGIVDVGNKTPLQVQYEVKEMLSRLIPDPEVNLTVIQVAGNNFFIIGKVNRPGRFPMNRPTDIVQAISLAGGFTPFASSDSIQILRRTGKRQQIIRFDYTKIADGEELETNILLKSGDTIVVP